MIRRILSSPLIQKRNVPVLQNANFATSKTSEKEGNKLQSVDEAKLHISDSCKRRLNEVCNDGSFLRLTVEGGGCSGFTYKFELDKELKEDDKVFGSNNAKVVVDSTSLEYCGGATIDYHLELIRTGFKVIANPKAEAGCSCGSSFAIRLD